MKVLAIGVHPDDVEFGMGGTLAKHILLGDEVLVVVLTDGKRDSTGEYGESYSRELESKKALKILGYKEEIKFLNLPHVEVKQSTINLIEREINEFKPDRIYTHSKNDRHQDHRNCYYIVLSAGRYINEILSFEVYSVLPEFLPNYIINISKELLNMKIRAIRSFKSQFKNMKLTIEMVKASAIKNGFSAYALQTNEFSYSEAFEIVKLIKKLESL